MADRNVTSRSEQSRLMPSGLKRHFTCCNNLQCRWGLIVFVIAFILSVIFRFVYKSLTPGKTEPNTFEAIQCVRIMTFVSISILLMAPVGLIYLYCEIPEKHLAMIYWGFLVVVLCFSLSGIISASSWMSNTDTEKKESMVEYAQAIFFGTHGLSVLQKELETKKKCCGVGNFMDYPLEIFEHGRVPDHCCVNYEKGCGRSLFSENILGFAHYYRNMTADVECEINLAGSERHTVDNLYKFLTFDPQIMVDDKEKPDEVTFLQYLIEKFKDGGYNEEDLCGKDFLDLDTFQDPICVYSSEASNNQEFISTRLRWCFALFKNGTSNSTVEFGLELNGRFNLVHKDGCYPYMRKYVDNLVICMLVFFIAFTILVSLMLGIYLNYYEDYRSRQLRIYPLPLWYQKLPEEREDQIPRGLGRICHTHHFLSLATEAQVKEYISAHPEIHQEVAAIRKKRRKSSAKGRQSQKSIDVENLGAEEPAADIEQEQTSEIQDQPIASEPGSLPLKSRKPSRVKAEKVIELSKSRVSKKKIIEKRGGGADEPPPPTGD